MNQTDIIQAINNSELIKSHTLAIGACSDAIVELNEKVEFMQHTIQTQMVTRDEFFQAHDTLIKLLTKLDEERIFIIDWQRRQDEDITKLKLVHQPA